MPRPPAERPQHLEALCAITGRSRPGPRTALRISPTAQRWSAPRLPAWKAGTSTPCGSTSRPSCSAREQGFVQNEGIANELAARFYAARGFETNAEAYLRKRAILLPPLGRRRQGPPARPGHPQLRQEPAAPLPAPTIGTSVEHLDLATVVKVSQAVSSEIDLEKLVDTLMVIALEHAGAERGVLILLRGDELRIEAEARTVRDAIGVRLRQAEMTPAELPKSVLRYVIRTRESVLLDDDALRKPFSADEYIRPSGADPSYACPWSSRPG